MVHVMTPLVAQYIKIISK